MRSTSTELVICPECRGLGYTSESFPDKTYSCNLCDGCGRTYKKVTTEYVALDIEDRIIAQMLREA